MDYQYFADRLGAKFDIVEGELVESETGQFTVSENFADFTIYVNKLERSVRVISPLSAYIGRVYRLRRSDCITLFSEWLDNHYNSNFGNIYKNYTNKNFHKYYIEGMSSWYEDNNFTKVTSPIEGDCIVYAHEPGIISHVGIYIDGDKILHHLPCKLSSLDDIDNSKIIGIYRYGN